MATCISELKPETHGPNCKNPLTGFAENEASELRNSILTTENTETYYEITGVRYYVSNSGDDSQDGLSPETAVKGLSGINKLDLKSGDAVLFERGSVFRFESALLVKSGVTYGSYGEGDKPEIYTAPKNYADESLWSPTERENIWQVYYPFEEVCGMFLDFGYEIGCLWRGGIEKVRQNGDFCQDEAENKIFLYCDKGNPGRLYKSIEITYRMHAFIIVPGVENIVIDNICLKYIGGFPITGDRAGDGITVTNCEIGFAGGLFNGTVRFGNAFELWDRAKKVKFEHNWVYQTFDSAITWQGRTGCNEYVDISFCDNLFEYNNADLEFFERYDAKVQDFRMENNILRFTSNGWGTHEPEGGPRGIEGCIRAYTGTLAQCGYVSFKNNIIDCPARQIINWESNPENRVAVDIENNKYYISSSHRTTEVAMQGFSIAPGESTFFTASNEEQFKKAIARFDDKAEIYYID